MVATSVSIRMCTSVKFSAFGIASQQGEASTSPPPDANRYEHTPQQKHRIAYRLKAGWKARCSSEVTATPVTTPKAT